MRVDRRVAIVDEAGNPISMANESSLLLASGSYTETFTSADIDTSAARGITVVLDMTDVTSNPSVTLTIYGKDVTSGKYYAILTGAPVTTVSTNVYRVIVGVTVIPNQQASLPLPETIRLEVVANNANPAVYSVGYDLHS